LPKHPDTAIQFTDLIDDEEGARWLSWRECEAGAWLVALIAQSETEAVITVNAGIEDSGA